MELWNYILTDIKEPLACLPLGILLPVVNRIHWKHIFVINLCFSVLLEMVQLLMGSGYCQMDDVIMNTLGCCLGYLVYKRIKILGRKIG